MDDTESLASELLHKLAEFDQKVVDYRRDLAQQFHRYSSQLLREVPKHISAQVEKLVSDQLQNYPALNPDLDCALDSPPLGGDDNVAGTPARRLSGGTVSPPPYLPHTSVRPASDDGPRSPREREHDFHGLLLPSYLPLLDAVPRPNPPPIAITSPPIPLLGKQESNSNEAIHMPTLANPPDPRPEPVRRQTQDSFTSFTSDDSTSRSRRSALRRSSSSSAKTSPRRVRFDVEGQEVLPTSSPPLSPRPLDIPTSPPGNPGSLLDDSLDPAVLDGDSNLLGNSPPRPKKITSTDRLKAMTRNSTEDTSNWTVVGNLHTDDEEEDELVMASLNGRSRTPSANPVNDTRLPNQSGLQLEVSQEDKSNDTAAEDEGTDEILEMTPLTSFKGKKRFSPPRDMIVGAKPETPKSQNKAHARAAQMKLATTDVGSKLDEEDMFEFEDGEDNSPSEKSANIQLAPKYIEEEEEGETTPTAEHTEKLVMPNLYSTSPAVPIAKTPVQPLASAPIQPSAGVAGSYKGKPFSIGVVRDKTVLKRAADLGEFSSFVGSVDGRSGVDESNSYRPEPSSFNGTPKSLSERLMMEEFAEARQKAKDTENIHNQ
ncbi:hypothetical protein F5Y15DRAFT_256321 [Xylariaceae sp. FL0016]|nr:hypothetical protein F5Y15DRAFT_256321 [Xylariaceae sp. FL0016]